MSLYRSVTPEVAGSSPVAPVSRKPAPGQGLQASGVLTGVGARCPDHARTPGPGLKPVPNGALKVAGQVAVSVVDDLTEQPISRASSCNGDEQTGHRR